MLSGTIPFWSDFSCILKRMKDNFPGKAITPQVKMTAPCAYASILVIGVVFGSSARSGSSTLSISTHIKSII